jgi:ABC-type branched-subunit amino acid transport system substrate-binding protein
VRLGRLALVAAVALVVGACASSAGKPAVDVGSAAVFGPPGGSSAPSLTGLPIRIGAVFPLTGNAAGLAGLDLAGVRIAADFVNADGGIGGRPIVLDVKDLPTADAAPAVMAGLKADGVSAVIGAYASNLSIAASQAADSDGLVYWESGAVADQLTGRGLPLVFRVGASGSNLGANSASFAASELAPRLGRAATALRVAIVAADDDYATSVADAAASTARAAGLPIVLRTTYNLSYPQWPQLMTRLAAAHPDVIILASHIPDGIAFRQAMLTAGLKVGALIGSTMAECDPDFAGELGAAAIGIFASDRPTGGFDANALDPAARALYVRFASALVASGVSLSTSGSGAGSAYTNVAGATVSEPAAYTLHGPIVAASSDATEEALSGFSAAWALFHDVLPAAAAVAVMSAPARSSGDGNLAAATIAIAARALDLPNGSLPNGAGVRFSSAPATLGQNERAAAVIWQWQAVRSYTFVWPPTYATGTIGFVPLPR